MRVDVNVDRAKLTSEYSRLQTAAVDYAMLVVARFIGGVGIGMLSMVAPLYISEISPPEIRGALLVLEELSIVSGIVIAFWITYGTQYIMGEWSWRLPFLLQMVPGLVLGVGILFLPFSPRWLVSKGRDFEAGRSLSKLRQLDITDGRVQQEWIDIRAEVAFHQEVSTLRHPNLQDRSTVSRMKLEVLSWTDCFKRGCWRRTHVGVGLMFFQQFVGSRSFRSSFNPFQNGPRVTTPETCLASDVHPESDLLTPNSAIVNALVS